MARVKSPIFCFRSHSAISQSAWPPDGFQALMFNLGAFFQAAAELFSSSFFASL